MNDPVDKMLWEELNLERNRRTALKRSISTVNSLVADSHLYKDAAERKDSLSSSGSDDGRTRLLENGGS